MKQVKTKPPAKAPGYRRQYGDPTVPVTMRLPRDIWAQLKESAARNQRPLAWEAGFVLRAGLEKLK